MVFSVGKAEGEELQRKATGQALEAIQARLRELSAVALPRRLELVGLRFDSQPGESVIEELPDQPKSSRPQAVELSVRLRATYAVR